MSLPPPLIGSESYAQIERDELYARQLQEQYDREREYARQQQVMVDSLLAAGIQRREQAEQEAAVTTTLSSSTATLTTPALPPPPLPPQSSTLSFSSSSSSSTSATAVSSLLPPSTSPATPATTAANMPPSEAAPITASSLSGNGGPPLTTTAALALPSNLQLMQTISKSAPSVAAHPSSSLFQTSESLSTSYARPRPHAVAIPLSRPIDFAPISAIAPATDSPVLLQSASRSNNASNATPLSAPISAYAPALPRPRIGSWDESAFAASVVGSTAPAASAYSLPPPNTASLDSPRARASSAICRPTHAGQTGRPPVSAAPNNTAALFQDLVNFNGEANSRPNSGTTPSTGLGWPTAPVTTAADTAATSPHAVGGVKWTEAFAKELSSVLNAPSPLTVASPSAAAEPAAPQESDPFPPPVKPRKVGLNLSTAFPASPNNNGEAPSSPRTNSSPPVNPLRRKVSLLIGLTHTSNEPASVPRAASPFASPWHSSRVAADYFSPDSPPPAFSAGVGEQPKLVTPRAVHARVKLQEAFREANAAPAVSETAASTAPAAPVTFDMGADDSSTAITPPPVPARKFKRANGIKSATVGHTRNKSRPTIDSIFAEDPPVLSSPALSKDEGSVGGPLHTPLHPTRMSFIDTSGSAALETGFSSSLQIPTSALASSNRSASANDLTTSSQGSSSGTGLDSRPGAARLSPTASLLNEFAPLPASRQPSVLLSHVDFQSSVLSPRAMHHECSIDGAPASFALAAQGGVAAGHALDADRTIRPAIGRCRVLYDYSASRRFDIAIEKGEEMDVVSEENDGWWYVRKDSGEEGFVPGSYVERIPKRLGNPDSLTNLSLRESASAAGAGGDALGSSLLQASQSESGNAAFSVSLSYSSFSSSSSSSSSPAPSPSSSLPALANALPVPAPSSKRFAVAKEILETEITYIDGLQAIIALYKRPLTEKSSVLTQKDACAIFPNELEEILKNHNVLLRKLSDRIGNWTELVCFGDIFTGPVVDFFTKYYVPYCNQFPIASEVLHRCIKSNEKFRAFLKHADSCRGQFINSLKQARMDRMGSTLVDTPGGNPRSLHRSKSVDNVSTTPMAVTPAHSGTPEPALSVGGPTAAVLGLDSLLLTPIQRMPRYVLLIQQMLKHTPSSHPDRFHLAHALDRLRRLTDYVNECKRDMENSARLAQMSHSIKRIPKDLYNPARRLVRESDVMVYKGSVWDKGRLFLLNDALLFTSNRMHPGKKVDFEALKFLDLMFLKDLEIKRQTHCSAAETASLASASPEDSESGKKKQVLDSAFSISRAGSSEAGSGGGGLELPAVGSPHDDSLAMSPNAASPTVVSTFFGPSSIDASSRTLVCISKQRTLQVSFSSVDEMESWISDIHALQTDLQLKLRFNISREQQLVDVS